MAASTRRKKRRSSPRSTTATKQRSTRKSPLSARTNRRRNTQRGRASMSRSNFAVPRGKGSKPGQAQYRVDDKAHARNALSRVAQHGTPEEKRMVRRKVSAKYPGIGQQLGASTTRRKKRKRRS